MSKLESHEYANIFPLVEGNEFEELKEDIKKNGLLMPIYLYEGKILDGRNRYKACQAVGVEPKFVEYKGNTPLNFVISLNLKRRHLSQSQRAISATQALPMFEKEAKKRQSLAGGATPGAVSAKLRQADKGKASEKVAKAFYVSPRYVQEAKKLEKEHPELVEEVKLGKISLSQIKKRTGRPREEDWENYMIVRRIYDLIKQKKLYCLKCKKHELQWSCCDEKLETTVKTLTEKYKL